MIGKLPPDRREQAAPYSCLQCEWRRTLHMISQNKTPSAAIAAFGFTLLYVGIALSTQLPVLLSRPIPPGSEREAAARTGAIVGIIIECAGIMALGFGILKKRVWAAWLLFALAIMEIMFVLVRQNFINAPLPLILGSLALWAAASLRAQAHNER
jgi:hypothetical protein